MRIQEHPLQYDPRDELPDLPLDGISIQHLVQTPKIDLHRHLIGAIRPEVLVYIANKLGISLMGGENDVEQIRKASVIAKRTPDGYEHFLRKRIWKHYKEIFAIDEGIHNSLYWAIADAARDGVVYVEFRVSPNSQEFNPTIPIPLVRFLYALGKGIEAASRDFPDTVARIILSVGRNAVMGRWGDREERNRRFSRLTKTAEDYRDFVVGFDITGNENEYPNALFEDFAEHVSKAGFPLTAHAGETGDAQAVVDAVKVLNVKRVGHGLGAINDQPALELLRDREIALELCPTSNLMLGVVEDMKTHPCKDFMEHGLRITINTDDPTLLGPTTMSREFYELLVAGQIDIADIPKITDTSLEYSFADASTKENVRAKMVGSLQEPTRTNSNAERRDSLTHSFAAV